MLSLLQRFSNPRRWVGMVHVGCNRSYLTAGPGNVFFRRGRTVGSG